jgi:hypothetical protein
LDVFDDEVAHLADEFGGQQMAEQIGVEPVLVTVRSMRHKWGSCSSAGRLTFDRDLLVRPALFRARVIVHELLHLKYPQHGKVFRSMERAYLDSDFSYFSNVTTYESVLQWIGVNSLTNQQLDSRYPWSFISS